MNRGTFIEKLTEVQQTIAQLVAQLQSSEHDPFAAHHLGAVIYSCIGSIVIPGIIIRSHPVIIRS